MLQVWALAWASTVAKPPPETTREPPKPQNRRRGGLPLPQRSISLDEDATAFADDAEARPA